MKLTRNLFLAVVLVSAAALCANKAHAADITWVGTNTGTWLTTTNWSNAEVPSSGNTYTVDGSGKTINNPDTSSNVFAGDSLTVKNSAVLRLFRTNGGTNINITNTIPNLTLDAATITVASSSGSITQILANQVTLANAAVVEMNGGGGFTNQLTFNNGFTGSGTLALQRSGTTGSGRNVNINGTNSTSGYSGNVTTSGNSSTKTLAVSVNTASGWGTGSLTVNAWSTVTLTPAANAAAGTTVAVNNNGNLVINGNISTSGLTTVNTGGTLRGTGTTGSVTVASGGNFAPGVGGIESLNVDGTLTLSEGSVSNFEINRTGGISDMAIASALLAFGGTLNVSNIGDPLVLNDTFNLFDWGSTSGAFSAVNLPALDPGLSWDQSALYTSGALTVIPEPNVAALIGFGMLTLLRRRRN
jgi:hypothetical protein